MYPARLLTIGGRLTALLLVGLLIAALRPTPLRAATIQVTTLQDETSSPATCSLREAIQSATTNLAVGGCPAGSTSPDTITFAPAVTGTISLTLGTLNIGSGVLTIDGPGAAALTISGGGAAQLLNVAAGAQLTLEGLTLANGQSVSGGAVFNQGTLTITSSILSGNTADLGGAVANALTGSLTITNSTLSGNTASFGGAIDNDYGSLTITSSTLSGNQAALGAAIRNTGTLAITNSTLSGNTATGDGGAIFNQDTPGTLTLTNSTVAGNQGGAGGALATYAPATTSLKNVVLANPSPSCSGDGQHTDLGGNVAADAACTFTQMSSHTNTNPNLGSLQNNGGATLTMALPIGSPAINAGVNCPPPATDQRGQPRTSPCDSGAFEAVPPPTVTAVTPSSGPQPGSTAVTISGTSFVPGQTSVAFGSTAATNVSCGSATSCSATSPPGTGSVSVRVTTLGGTSADTPSDNFTYLPPPSVTGVSPNSGAAAGGTSVTISGTNFVPGQTSVVFGATPATNVSCPSATSCTATSPAGAGAVSVRVTVAGQQSADTPADNFSYVPSVTGVSPNHGLDTGGTSVSISGTGFVPGQTTITFGSLAGSVSCFNATSCTATSPPGTVGTVSVEATVAGQTSAQNGAFSYDPRPMTVTGTAYIMIPPIVSEGQTQWTALPWVNKPVVALIGGIGCGQAVTNGQGQFQLTVAPDPPSTGCGYPGRVVSFTVNGHAMQATVSFQSGGSTSVTLTYWPP